MGDFGKIFVLIGAIWGVIAFNMDTTVATESKFIGDTYIPSRQVHNIGKMEDRRNHLMLAGLMIIAGVILFAVGSRKSPIAQSDDTRKCPFCAEMVKEEAKICKHCGKELPPVPKRLDRLLVTEVADGSEASRRGIQVDDILNSFNDQPIKNDDFLSHLMKHHNGQEHTLMVIRDRKHVSLTLTAGPLGIKVLPTVCDEPAESTSIG